jgi:hypothetical protein
MGASHNLIPPAVPRIFGEARLIAESSLKLTMDWIIAKGSHVAEPSTTSKRETGGNRENGLTTVPGLVDILPIQLWIRLMNSVARRSPYYAGVFLTSLATLLLELSLTRIFSVVLF